MNAEFKAKWVEALRSGRYLQGHQRLRRGDTYCCLGVLCDLIDPARWEKENKDSPTSGYLWYIGEGQGYSVEYLSDNSLAVVKLTDAQQRKLARMNDLSKSFQEIADYIEKKL